MNNRTQSTQTDRLRTPSLLRSAATGETGLMTLLIAGILLLWAPADSFAMSASPTALRFSGTTGTTNPPAQTITFWKSGDRTRNWTVNASAPWISVTPSSGTIATEQDQITVSVNATGLSAGSYTSTVVIATESFKGRLVKTIVPVSLSLTQSSTATPTIRLSPAALSFSGIAGSTNPAAQLLSLTNSSGGTLSWSLSDNAAWLTLSTASGMTTTETDSIAASVNLTGLAAGTYTAAITVSASGATNSPQIIPVSLTVTAASTATPVIGLSVSSLAFSGTAGGVNPAAQSFTISNTGAGTLTWTASDNAAWLTLSPATGTNTGTVSATVNLAGLTAGTYSGTITAAATGATSRTIPVSLTVNPATTATPIIGLSLASLTYVGTAGGANPAAQSFTVSNTGAGTLTWTAGDSASWLTLTPATGTNTGTVSASVNLAGLAAGTYSGTITVSAAGATSRTLPVSLTVGSGTSASNSATLTWVPNTETDLAGYKIYVGTQSGVYGDPIVLGRVNTYQVANLVVGTTYFFCITAYDNAGNESARSVELTKSIF
jgi:hypothetical protein